MTTELAKVSVVTVQPTYPIPLIDVERDEPVGDTDLDVLITAFFIDKGLETGKKVKIERFTGRRGSRWVIYFDGRFFTEVSDWDIAPDRPLKALLAEKLLEAV